MATSWQKANKAKYDKHVADNPDLVPIEFLDEERRAAHLCNTAEEANEFLAYHLDKADRTPKGSIYYMVFDQESWLDKEDSWGMREWKGKLNRRDFLSRRRVAQKLHGDWGGWSPQEKVERYWSHHIAQRERGIQDGCVAAISVTACDDVNGDHLFVMNMPRIVERSYGGEARVPAKFIDLLTHEAVVWVNVAIYDDIHLIMKSFVMDPPEKPIKYVEAAVLVKNAWPNWTARDKNGDPKSNPSLLEIIEADNPGRTFNKDSDLTTAECDLPWGPKMIRYTMEDSDLLARTAKKIIDSDEVIMDMITYNFPKKKLPKNKGKNKGKKKEVRAIRR